MSKSAAASVLLLTVLCLAAVAVRCHVVLHRDQLAYSSNMDGDRPTDHAKVARDLVHAADWTSFGTVSSRKELAGFPMVNIISVADSKRGAPSTGDIYFLLTDLDFTGQDLNKDNKLTLLFTQEANQNCSRRNIDAMEPTCARVMISGSRQRLNNDTKEYAFAFEAFSDRHPAASKWIEEHDFYLCKVQFSSIIVLDYYGGPHFVSVADYYAHSDQLPATDDDLASDRNAYRTVGIPDSRRHSVRIHVDSRTNDIIIDV